MDNTIQKSDVLITLQAWAELLGMTLLYAAEQLVPNSKVVRAKVNWQIGQVSMFHDGQF
jgi:hypothetical protein